jgi:hypothetical protein
LSRICGDFRVPQENKGLFTIVFITGPCKIKIGDNIIGINHPKLSFASLNSQTVVLTEDTFTASYYCKVSPSFLKRYLHFDLVHAYEKLTTHHPLMISDKSQENTLVGYFEAMLATQSSEYVFKNDQIRDYVALVIHEGLKDAALKARH